MAKNQASDGAGKTVKIGRIGDLKVVSNQNKHKNANSQYYAIRLQCPDGQEINALFTEHQIKEAVKRAEKNPEDVPTAGSLFTKMQDLLD